MAEDCRGRELPRFVRRLVWETAPDTVQMDSLRDRGPRPGSLAVTTIVGGSLEQIRAFIAAVVDRQAREGDSQWRSRAAFVDQVTS